jgi:protein-tyrosine phosphatase
VEGCAGGWDPVGDGVLALPDGRLVRGRGLSAPLPPGPQPQFGLYLLGRRPEPQAWPARWLRWPDFRLPADQAEAVDALIDLWRRAAAERVELACGGGRGRTGTALACLAVLAGVRPEDAVGYVRRHYRAGAVETPWQRRYVLRFARSTGPGSSPRRPSA